jgi:hypothetical protein
MQPKCITPVCRPAAQDDLMRPKCITRRPRPQARKLCITIALAGFPWPAVPGISPG